MEKTDALVIGIVAFAVIISIFSAFYIFNITGTTSNQQSQNSMSSSTSRMKLTSFDATLARKLMDADGDGKCDVCGMDVQLCMDGGQLQCNMDQHSTIGILGSAHIHADFKVFINGNAINFADKKYYMKSSFIHVDDNQNKEDASGVLHMHATGVPLWIFFDSVEMEFNKDCLSLPTGERFCNDGKKTLKFYVNGKFNDKYEKYVFSDLDKILISYGDETDLSHQLNSITEFSMNH